MVTSLGLLARTHFSRAWWPRVRFKFWLVHLVFCGLCNWLVWFLWFWTRYSCPPWKPTKFCKNRPKGAKIWKRIWKNCRELFAICVHRELNYTFTSRSTYLFRLLFFRFWVKWLNLWKRFKASREFCTIWHQSLQERQSGNDWGIGHPSSTNCLAVICGLTWKRGGSVVPYASSACLS